MPPSSSKNQRRLLCQPGITISPTIWAKARRFRRSVFAYTPFLLHRRALLSILLVFTLVGVWFSCVYRNVHNDGAGAIVNLGTAQADLLPSETVFLSGFSSRREPPRAASLLTPLAPLRVKVLVLNLPEASSQGDDSVSAMVVITFDLIGIDKALSDAIYDALHARHGFVRRQVRLVFSHTHSGPAVGRNLFPLLSESDAEKAKIARYADFLLRTVVDAVDRARSPENIEQARVFFGKGSCSIAVNRRQIVEKLFTEGSSHGDIDPELPVMWFREADMSNDIIAGIFGVAAHATVLTSSNEYSGDYPAAVSAALSKVYPRSVWFFLPGCGGDLNIYPRGNQSMLLQHRDAIVREVQRVIAKEKIFEPVFSPLNPSTKLLARHAVLPLRFRKTFSLKELRRMRRSSDVIMSRTATALMSTLTADFRTRATYAFPMSMFRIGRVSFLFLGGEPTVDYASRIRVEAGASWVVGYTDDVMGYVGSERVLREVKREGSDRAALYYGLPCAWDVGIEADIVRNAGALLKRGPN